MTLPDGPRQLIASALAAAVFLGLFIGTSLVWWLALTLAVVTYFALLLVVRRRRPAEEIMVSDLVSAADIRNAARDLQGAADRLRAASGAAPATDKSDLEAMAGHVLSIRAQITADPKDFRRTRRFVGFYLPRIVETVEGYVDLARHAHGADSARLAEIGGRIKGFLPVIEKIDRACLENDFAALEVEVDVLGMQLDRG